MNSLVLVLLMTCLSWGSMDALTSSLTRRHITRFKALLTTKILETASFNEFGNPYHPLIAGFIRLGFHSCVGEKCLGCINVNDSNNNGLNVSINALEVVLLLARKDRILKSVFITRADLWTLAAAVAFDIGERKNADGFELLPRSKLPAIRFRYGREDCPTAPYFGEYANFPSRVWNIDSVLLYFSHRGFDARETVALMGAHSVGVVRDLGSPAVIAQWVDDPDEVRNQYYRDLIDPSSNWHQVPRVYTALAKPIYSWTMPDNTNIMLNSDISLIRNISFIDASSGKSSCNLTTCPPSATESIVFEYARSRALWRQDFSHAYSKLIERGYQALSYPQL